MNLELRELNYMTKLITKTKMKTVIVEENNSLYQILKTEKQRQLSLKMNKQSLLARRKPSKVFLPSQALIHFLKQKKLKCSLKMKYKTKIT